MIFFQIPALPEFILSTGDYDSIRDCYQILRRIIFFSEEEGKLGVKNKQNLSNEDMEAYKFAVSQPGNLY